MTFLAISHYTYLLSFPLGSFPYGYHTAFNVGLATVHSLAWVLWSASFYISIPALSLGGKTWQFQPYPPQDPSRVKSPSAATPLALVVLTTAAMSFELLDFPPILRMLDAHALWHAATIPLAAGWWRFLCTDAINLESAQFAPPPPTSPGNMPLTGGASLAPGSTTPKTPGMTSGAGGGFQQIASAGYPSRSRTRSPGWTPGGSKGDLQE